MDEVQLAELTLKYKNDFQVQRLLKEYRSEKMKREDLEKQLKNVPRQMSFEEMQELEMRRAHDL